MSGCVQGQLVGGGGAASRGSLSARRQDFRAKVYNMYGRGQNFRLKIPSSRLAASGSPRTACDMLTKDTSMQMIL